MRGAFGTKGTFSEASGRFCLLRGHTVGAGQIDLLVGQRLVVELKAVEGLAPVHAVQLRSYLKATKNTLGLLINFNVAYLRQGIRRIILSDSGLGVCGAVAFQQRE
jgi:GxxExxY protein